MITRRHCLSAALAALAAPMALPVWAQKKLPVVAFLHSQLAPPPEEEAKLPLRVRMRELGWDEGRNMRWLTAYAEGRPDRLPGLAAGLVEQKVDVIVAAGAEATRAARQATDTIPIVAVGPDLVAMGYAASLARPGGNVTGPSLSAGPGGAAKRLEVLKLALPAAKRIAFVHNSSLTAGTKTAAGEAARAQGLALSLIMVDNPADLDAAFAQLSRNRPDATWWADSPVNIQQHLRITEFGARERLPAIYGIPQFVESGGLMSYGVSLAERSRTAASYVDKILRGAKPGELPIEQATALSLAINLKAARALGIVFPQELLLSAQQVIE
jgi:putative ABC transport system substrate-binding protein